MPRNCECAIVFSPLLGTNKNNNDSSDNNSGSNNDNNSDNSDNNDNIIDNNASVSFCIPPYTVPGSVVGYA